MIRRLLDSYIDAQALAQHSSRSPQNEELVSLMGDEAEKVIC
jgi:hypothetical protein